MRWSLASSVVGQSVRGARDEEGMQLVLDSQVTEMLKASHTIDVVFEDDGLSSSVTQVRLYVLIQSNRMMR